MPTDTEPTDTLIAGRELDARINYAVHGWRWFRRTAGSDGGVGKFAFFPPLRSDYERVNYHPDFFEEVDFWPAESERFTDWSRCGFMRVAGRLVFMPRPSSEIGAAMEALNAAADSYSVEKYGPADDGDPVQFGVTIWQKRGGTYPQGLDPDPCLAICAAILAAKKGDTDNA